MTHQANLQGAQATIGWAIGAKHLAARVAEIFSACAASWEAAALYENLSRLSDAELRRRGISRSELHRCVFETVTRDT
jgi:hypothetical protein